MNDDLVGRGSRDLFEIATAALNEGNREVALACLRQLQRIGTPRAIKRARDLQVLLQATPAEGYQNIFRRDQSGRSSSICSGKRVEYDPSPSGSRYRTDDGHDLWSRIADDVGEIVDVANVQRAGRTAYPERRLLQLLGEHGLSFLSILHWANGLKEADRCEARLLQLLRRVSGRVVNDPDDHGGTGSYAGDFHAIYVAWAPSRGSSLRNFTFKQSPASDPRERPWPVQAPHFKTVHLRCLLSRDEASERVFEEIQDRRQYYACTRGR